MNPGLNQASEETFPLVRRHVREEQGPQMAPSGK